MKAIAAVVFFLVPVFLFGQDSATPKPVGCGPDDIQFSVKVSKDNAPLQPEKGKALVYMLATEEYDPRLIKIGRATTRVGVDGNWVGANRGETYFVFSIDPGLHHICTNWQSSVGFLKRLAAAIPLNAEAGKTYYFQTKVDERTDRPQEIRIEHLEADEAEPLIDASTYSIAQVKR